MKKRILSLLSALVMAAALLPVTALAAGTGSQCGDRQQGSGHHKGRKKGENTLFHAAGPSFRIICFSLRAE